MHSVSGSLSGKKKARSRDKTKDYNDVMGCPIRATLFTITANTRQKFLYGLDFLENGYLRFSSEKSGKLSGEFYKMGG